MAEDGRAASGAIAFATLASFTPYFANRLRRVTAGADDGLRVGSNDRLRVAATVAGGALAALLFGSLLAHVDLRAMGRAMTSAGPLVVLAPMPFAFGMALDAFATRTLVGALGAEVRFFEMWPVRVASEALHISVPAGFVASDTATAMLLRARAGVPTADGVVASIARRWLVMRAHAVYVVLAGVLGFPIVASLSRRLIGTPAIAWMVLASAALPLAASSGVGATLLGRSTFARLRALVGCIPSKHVARWAAARERDAVSTDAQIVRLRAARGATATASLCFLGCWCVEALESAFLLHLVGADLALPAVAATEAGITLLRSIAVIAPSGFGVVDLGYAAVFPALGAGPDCAAAFVVLKRGKELVWVAIGYATLALLRGGGRSPEASTAAKKGAAWIVPGLRGGV